MVAVVGSGRRLPPSGKAPFPRIFFAGILRPDFLLWKLSRKRVYPPEKDVSAEGPGWVSMCVIAARISEESSMFLPRLPIPSRCQMWFTPRKAFSSVPRKPPKNCQSRSGRRGSTVWLLQPVRPGHEPLFRDTLFGTRELTNIGAVQLCTQIFARNTDGSLMTIGLGDSADNISMLKCVDIPILLPRIDCSFEHIDLNNLIKAKHPSSRGVERHAPFCIE